MTAQELKNSILQLAIQGKLVEQRPDEGTAEELYRRIQSEKAKLLKAGKIKKEKPLPEITEDEIPFEIPETWKWVRWGNLSESIQYGYNAPAQDSGHVKMVRISDIQDGKVLWNTVPYCNIEEEYIETYLLKANDILFARTGGTVGKSYLVKEVPENIIYAGYLIRTRYSCMLSPEYMKYFMESQLYWNQLHDGTIATAQPNCNGKTLSKMILPLPPLEEQKRIVAKIEEIFPYIERFGELRSQLRSISEDLRKSILQQAIRGKLVEQRPEEGTAEELYRQIQSEKAKLLKSGKIKKEKPLPEITKDEIPFEIPETWKWVRLSSIGITQTGNTPSKKYPEYIGKDIPFITPGDILNGRIDYKNQALSFLGKEVARVSPSGTILQVCIGGSIGKAAITNQEVTYNQQINAITPIICESCYAYFVMTSPYFITHIKNNAGGTATPIINKGLWDNLLFPLPPFSEQKRIIIEAEKLLKLCDKLK